MIRWGLRVGSLIDGTKAEPLAGAVIVVEDDRIVAVESSAPEGLEFIRDHRNGTAIPGMIDGHVHLIFKGNDPFHQGEDEDDPRSVLRAACNARTALGAGVTTVRDCADRHFLAGTLKRAIEDGLLAGPRILTSGSPVTPTGGHLHDLGLACDGRLEMIKAARYLCKVRQVDWVKLCMTGGGKPPATAYDAYYGVEDLTAFAEDVHRMGRRIAAHALGTEAIRRLVSAGIDTIEHCTWFVPGGIEYDHRTVQEMRAKSLAACVNMPGRRPAGVRLGLWATTDDERFANIIRMRDAGVGVFLGTDAGITGVGFAALPYAVEDLVNRVGLSPHDAIKMVTGDAAEILGLDEVGVIRPGNKADLVVLGGDPLAEIAAIERVEMVVRDGKVVVGSQGLSA